ncbi:MAG: hypothetical protein J7527_01640 [Chitinophagaceae bacterium]|nr:hypothetical protein [Chitinophagaceae bacterium]
MATKKKIPAKKKKASVKRKGPGSASTQFKPGNKAGKKFEKGNTAALVWTAEKVEETLRKMWDTLTTDEYGDKPSNPIRANDIKTLAEPCLIHGVSKQRISEWEKDFKDVPAVAELLKNIKWVIETRLMYSGTFMDIFVMKNHYDYVDKKDVDHTTKGKAINQAPITFIPADRLSDEQLQQYLNQHGGTGDESVSGAD